MTIRKRESSPAVARLLIFASGLSIASSSSGTLFCQDIPDQDRLCGIVKDLKSKPMLDKLFKYDRSRTVQCPFNMINEREVTVHQRCNYVITDGKYHVNYDSDSLILKDEQSDTTYKLKKQAFLDLTNVLQDTQHWGTNDPHIELLVDHDNEVQVYGSITSTPTKENDVTLSGKFFVPGLKHEGTLAISFFKAGPHVYCLVYLDSGAYVLTPGFDKKMTDALDAGAQLESIAIHH